MWAVLSKPHPEDDKLHPCAFLSWKVSPTETNYDMGNQEMLSVKVASEE